MDPAQLNLACEAINCVNRFLKLCNLKEVEMPEAGDISDSAIAIEQLAKELLDIVERKEDTKPNSQPDFSVTQITATNKELDERIQAFMIHAQNVVDEQNVKEFCDSSTLKDVPGCARTDACYRGRMSSSTHMQVKKAANTDGPQLKVTAQGIWRNQAQTNLPLQEALDGIPQPIAERLNNLEMHLNVRNPGHTDVYTRLKNLENRLLAIEGTSPEYFSTNNHADGIGHQKESSPSDPRNFSLQEIDDRIRMLKQKLSSKKRKFEDESCLL